METQNTLAASVQPKKGRLYAVIQVKENGKSKAVWRSLGLPENTGKSKVNKAFREVVKKFENEYAEGLSRNGRPSSDIPVFEYMCAYLKKVEPSLQKSTFQSYHMMVYGKIRRYFESKQHLTVGAMTAKDIEKFYEHLFAQNVVANTVIHYHAILHKAFQQAFKDELIDANPFDRIDRPKKNKFHGENYSEEELVTLLELTRSDSIYPAIMLAAGLVLEEAKHWVCGGRESIGTRKRFYLIQKSLNIKQTAKRL